MKKKITVLVLVFLCSLVSAQVLYIYGGENHTVYLGALNTSKYDSESIWNAYGTYGSKYSLNSIWNEYGTYGGKYSNYSPFNRYASFPPGLYDGKGDFYGYFTVNAYQRNRADFSLAETICSYFEYIQEDVSGWYDRLFR